MAQIPGSWCPVRTPQIPGARVPCDDTCALYISSSKLPPTHSCAVTAIGVYALQRIVVPKPKDATGEQPGGERGAKDGAG
ncbi:MAG: hypothetical protein FJ313_06240 [Gemmatimonadetes bacterium]|nr:hypothetical protein [Gemmatimonadota bacterium]